MGILQLSRKSLKKLQFYGELVEIQKVLKFALYVTVTLRMESLQKCRKLLNLL